MGIKSSGQVAPAGQSMGAEEPNGQYVRRTQEMGAVMPLVGQYFPAVQGSGVDMPVEGQ